MGRAISTIRALAVLRPSALQTNCGRKDFCIPVTKLLRSSALKPTHCSCARWWTMFVVRSARICLRRCVRKPHSGERVAQGSARDRLRSLAWTERQDSRPLPPYNVLDSILRRVLEEEASATDQLGEGWDVHPTTGCSIYGIWWKRRHSMSGVRRVLVRACCAAIRHKERRMLIINRCFPFRRRLAGLNLCACVSLPVRPAICMSAMRALRYSTGFGRAVKEELSCCGTTIPTKSDPQKNTRRPLRRTYVGWGLHGTGNFDNPSACRATKKLQTNCGRKDFCIPVTKLLGSSP